MPIKNVLLIGAGGNLGPYLLDALCKAHFHVTILARKSSTSKFPSRIPIIRIPDTYPYESLLEACRGQDAVVSSMNALVTDIQTRVVDAAVAAGVQRFVPAEFGLDSFDAESIRLLPPMAERVGLQKYLDSKASETFSWTAIATGLFLDYGLKSGLFNVDLQKRTFQILNDGKTKFSTSTMPTIAFAVVRVLDRLELTRNKFLFIQTLSTSQNELLQALQAATQQQWSVERITEADLLRRSQERRDRGDHKGTLDIVYIRGVLHSLYEDRVDFANRLLDLEDGNVKDVMSSILES